MSRLLGALVPFDRGHEPDKWIILKEPELHLSGDVLVPDLAGWRRERMPVMPDTLAFSLTPDWVCEVLSPATEALDRGRKMLVYAREQVAHVWMVNPISQVLEVYQFEEEGWSLVDVHEGNATVRGVPFEALALDLGLLWQR